MTRRFLRAAAPLLLLFALVVPRAASADAGAPAPPDAPASVESPAPGRLIVAFSEKNLTEAQARERLARFGTRLERWLPELGFARVEVPIGLERALAQRLEKESGIRFATEERKSISVADTPLDEHWGEQWGPQKVELPAAREITKGDPSVVIAVIDTGVNYNHWDLREQMWINPGESEADAATGARTCATGIAQNGVDDDGNGYVDDCLGYNFDAGSNDPGDQYGHGTVVAGIAGAATNNRGSHTDGSYEGIAGMGGASRVMAVRAMDASGRGWPFNIAEAVRYAVDNGASVINLSLTLGTTPNPSDTEMLCAAADYALAHDVVIAAASGNDSRYGLRPVSYPAACPGVIAVGASTQQDTRADFSNASDRLDLIAPGEWITSTLNSGNTAYGIFGRTGSGTSFAAPHVAGAAALIRGLRKDLRQDEVRRLLVENVDDVGEPGFDNLTGWGLLNAARAVEAAAGMPHARMLNYLPFVGAP